LNSDVTTARERERVVGRVADDTAVHEPVLLVQLRRDRRLQLGAPLVERQQLRSEHDAERLRGQHLTSAVEHIHQGHTPFLEVSQWYAACQC